MNTSRVVFIQRELEDNLGVLWMISYLASRGFDARVLIEEASTYHELAELRPAIVAYSCMTGQQDWIFASIRKANQSSPGSLCLVGGPHATFYPRMLETGPADGIVRGEGELALAEILGALAADHEPYGVLNTSWKVDGQIVTNPLRPLWADLDSLPRPDRSYYGRYRFLARNPYRIFITGRGCPFKCTFCFNHALQGLYGKSARYIRRHSVDYVLEDLAEVKERWGLNEVRFSDDHFALDAKWLSNFTSVYRKEIGRPFTVNARVDALDEEKISLLAEAGCRLVCFGVETGDEAARNTILNKAIKDEDLFRVAGLLKKYKIKFLSSNIIGLPGETAAQAWETVNINQKLGTDLPWFSMMQYYPGTRIHEQALGAGLLSQDFDPRGITSYFRNSYLKQDNLPELQNIHSFSILACWFPVLTGPARWLARVCKPNALFKGVFIICYGILSIRRANLSPLKIFEGFWHYFGRVWK